MKKGMRRLPYLIVLLIVSSPLAAEDPGDRLTVADTVEEVLRSDPGIRGSRNQVRQAREGFDLVRSSIQPRLNLDVRPYSYDQRRVPGTGGPQGPTDTITHGTGVGLEIQQPLRTSGRVTAGIDHRMSYIDPEGEDPRWEQVPEVSLGWSQPLLAGREFLGTRVYRAGLRDAEIDYHRAEARYQVERNGAVREALGLFVQVNTLRRTVGLLEETIVLLRRQLESAELDRQQGLISDTALLALQITLNNRRETLFSTQLQLVQIEQLLARMIGRPSLQGVELEFDVEPMDVSVQSDLRTAILDNPGVRARQLAVEQAEQRAVVNTRVDRPNLSVFSRARPVYPDPGEVSRSFSGSMTDLFGGEAGLDATVGISLSIPLLTSRQRAHRERIDELTRDSAEINLLDTEQVLANQLQTLLTNRRFLLERLELLATDVAYERRRVVNEQTLLDAGGSTRLRVREVELDLRSRENERSRVKAELFLNRLDILMTLGEDIAVAGSAGG